MRPSSHFCVSVREISKKLCKRQDYLIKSIKTKDDQEELLIWVDKDDNVLGSKTRRECHLNKKFIHRTAGIAIYNSRGEILLQRRSRWKDMNPGQWGVSSAGHVEWGKKYEETMLREAREELGVTIKQFELMAKFIIEGERETEMSTLYRAFHNGPFSPNKNEIEELKFFFPRQIKSLSQTGKLNLSTCAIVSLKKLKIL